MAVTPPAGTARAATRGIAPHSAMGDSTNAQRCTHAVSTTSTLPLPHQWPLLLLLLLPPLLPLLQARPGAAPTRDESACLRNATDEKVPAQQQLVEKRAAGAG